jgi:hypothetical protein
MTKWEIKCLLIEVRIAELEVEIKYLSGFCYNNDLQTQAETKRRVRDHLTTLLENQDDDS